MKNNRNTKKRGMLAGLGIFAGFSMCIFLVLLCALLLKNAGRKAANTSVVHLPEQTSTQMPPTEQSSEDDTESEPEPEYPEETIAAATDDFYYGYITDDVFSRIDGHSFDENVPVERGELRYVHILYTGTDGLSHEGELIVHESIAEDVLDIFYELYNIGYVLESVELVDNYGADDNASMIVNNTSAFNGRKVAGSDVWSNHAYGLAIDVNPLYNPYVAGEDTVLPSTARQFADRSQEFDMKIDENDACYRIFTEHGFTWGGTWENVKDYMHFEKLPE